MNDIELRIHDERSGAPGVLIEFSSLLSALVKDAGWMLGGRWEVFRGAYGYGEEVGCIEDALEDRQTVIVNGNDVLPLLLSGCEYFNHARIRLLEGGVEFGIHDSTFLYVKGERKLLDGIAAEFRATEFVEAS